MSEEEIQMINKQSKLILLGSQANTKQQQNAIFHPSDRQKLLKQFK
jgi:hypothetical protein